MDPTGVHTGVNWRETIVSARSPHGDGPTGYTRPGTCARTSFQLRACWRSFGDKLLTKSLPRLGEDALPGVGRFASPLLGRVTWLGFCRPPSGKGVEAAPLVAGFGSLLSGSGVGT